MMDDEVPETIGDYRIVRRLNKGRMGEVFLAEEPRTKEQVCLKRIQPRHQKNIQFQKAFIKEMKITQELSHSGVIPLLDLSFNTQMPFYVMPLVEGESLGDILENMSSMNPSIRVHYRQRFPVQRLLQVFLKVCNVVAYAHANGYLHKDIRGDNIILGPNDEMTLLDWGIADTMIEHLYTQRLQEFQPRVQEEFVAGSVYNTPPELYSRHPHTVQSDIYSLGIQLYRILAMAEYIELHLGFGLLARNSLQARLEHLQTEKYEDPSLKSPFRSFMPHLTSVAEKCLEFHPYNRYKCVEDLIADLELLQSPRPRWMAVKNLSVSNRSDWILHEQIYLAKKVLPSRLVKEHNINLLLSKCSLRGDLTVEWKVRLSEGAHGIGLLLGVFEADGRKQLPDGISCWFPTDTGSPVLLTTPDQENVTRSLVQLARNIWHRLKVVYQDNTLKIFLNDAPLLQKKIYSPVLGQHVGFYWIDPHFEISSIQLSCNEQYDPHSGLSLANGFLAKGEIQRAEPYLKETAAGFYPNRDRAVALFQQSLTAIQSRAGVEEVERRLKLLHASNLPHFADFGRALLYYREEEFAKEGECLITSLIGAEELGRASEEPYFYLVSRFGELRQQGEELAAALACALLMFRYQKPLSSSVQEQIRAIEGCWKCPDFWGEEKKSDRLLRLAFMGKQPYLIAQIVGNELDQLKPDLGLVLKGLRTLIFLRLWEKTDQLIDYIVYYFNTPQSVSNEVKWIHQMLHAKSPFELVDFVETDEVRKERRLTEELLKGVSIHEG